MYASTSEVRFWEGTTEVVLIVRRLEFYEIVCTRCSSAAEYCHCVEVEDRLTETTIDGVPHCTQCQGERPMFPREGARRDSNPSSFYCHCPVPAAPPRRTTVPIHDGMAVVKREECKVTAAA